MLRATANHFYLHLWVCCGYLRTSLACGLGGVMLGGACAVSSRGEASYLGGRLVRWFLRCGCIWVRYAGRAALCM